MKYWIDIETEKNLDSRFHGNDGSTTSTLSV
jgi:hypothetical protein